MHRSGLISEQQSGRFSSLFACKHWDTPCWWKSIIISPLAAQHHRFVSCAVNAAGRTLVSGREHTAPGASVLWGFAQLPTATLNIRMTPMSKNLMGITFSSEFWIKLLTTSRNFPDL